MKTDKKIKQQKGLSVQRSTLDSGVYEFEVKSAYLDSADSGAVSLTLDVVEVESKRKFKFPLWIQSGDAKGNKNFYVDREGDKVYLPGFVVASHLCEIYLGKDLSDCETEEIMVKKRVDGKDTQVEVEAITELHGEVVKIAVQRKITNKSEKVDGNYVDTNEPREENELAAVVNSAGFTMAELEADEQPDEPEELNAWLEHWEGKDNNRFKEVKEGGKKGGLKKKAAAAGKKFGFNKKDKAKTEDTETEESTED